MKLRRVFVSPRHVTRAGVVFPEEVSRRLQRVLRLKEGDHVEVFDGCSRYAVKLTDVRGSGVQGIIVGALDVRPVEGVEIMLAFCCVRPGPMEEIMRHCTELGVTRLIPLISLRTNRKPQEKKDRWISIVMSAAQQCGRVDLPKVEEPLAFFRFIEQAERPETCLILSRCDLATPMLPVLEELSPRRLLLVVGPEGGFEPAEEAAAFESGFRPVSLGRTTLRTETAAVVAVGTIVMWNDMRTNASLGQG